MVSYYNITGLTVEMDTFGRAASQAEPYLCSAAQPDIVISTDWRRLQENQPHLTKDDCEYISTGANFYNQLLNFDGMLLHASAVVLDDWAYLFSAPSGTGKSTHTTLWRKVFGEDNALILNDDKPALRWEDGRFYAYGTPWSGKTDMNLNRRVPLAGICMLERGACNEIEPFTGAQAVHALLEQTIRPKNPAKTVKLLELVDKLFAEVPVWRMKCNMDPEAARVSYEAMSAARKEV